MESDTYHSHPQNQHGSRQTEIDVGSRIRHGESFGPARPGHFESGLSAGTLGHALFLRLRLLHRLLVLVRVGFGFSVGFIPFC